MIKKNLFKRYSKKDSVFASNKNYSNINKDDSHKEESDIYIILDSVPRKNKIIVQGRIPCTLIPFI